MCRCCNWAFPDKTSLHMHVQAKEEGKSVSLPILGKGVPPSSDLLGNFPIHGLMPPGLGHATPQSLTHGNPFASLHSMANAVAGLPFSSESLAQFFPPFSLMQQNNEELMSKLRERLFLNNNPPWQPFPDPSRNTLMTKLSKKDLPSNASGSDGLDQSVESVSSNSSTDDSEEIQVIEDVESHENQDRPKTCDVPADSANYNNTSEKDSMSSSESGRLVNHIPESYYNSDTLRVDENEDSPLNIVDPIEENPGQNGNDNSPTATNSSASPSNSSSSASATSCCQCNLLKTKLAVIQTKCSYLEVHSATTQQEALRLRKQNELLISKLLECREKTLSFMHSEQSLPFVLNEILKVTLFQ
uniref:C2H2-type domain-containing protein n=1 Tax=Acrobeloides nanus TaxID=290746 RepID=A0A914E4Y3_9BILA